MDGGDCRTIHGTTDSSQMYSKGANKADSSRTTQKTIGQSTITGFGNVSNQLTNTTSNANVSAVTPTPVLPPTPSYDPFTFVNAAHNLTTATTTTTSQSHLDTSNTFHPSSPSTDTNLLDPQLLALQPSPQHMLPTPFTTDPHSQLHTSIDHSSLHTSIDQSPDSLPGPSPFTWNDFTFFDELNHSLGILNPTDDMQSQIDLLMNSMVHSGPATGTWPSSPNPIASIGPVTLPTNASGLAITTAETTASGCPLAAEDPLFRIPTANEVPIKGVHSAPPPTRNLDKKLDETAWKGLVEQILTYEKVIVALLLHYITPSCCFSLGDVFYHSPYSHFIPPRCNISPPRIIIVTSFSVFLYHPSFSCILSPSLISHRVLTTK